MAMQKTRLSLPGNSKDLPATRGMLQLVRTELKADISALRSEVKSGFSKIESTMEMRFEMMNGELARMGLLLEEQNANNRIVLEGLTGLYHRQERVESTIKKEVDRAVDSRIARSKA